MSIGRLSSMGMPEDHVELSSPEETGRPQPILSDHAVLVAQFLTSLANSTRLRILSVIISSEDGEATVGEIADAVGLRQPSVTHHINILEGAGVVSRHPSGRRVLCRVKADMAPIVTDLLA